MVINEMSYSYVDTAIFNAPGYYILGDEIKFIAKNTWPQFLWVAALINRLQNINGWQQENLNNLCNWSIRVCGAERQLVYLICNLERSLYVPNVCSFFKDTLINLGSTSGSILIRFCLDLRSNIWLGSWTWLIHGFYPIWQWNCGCTIHLLEGWIRDRVWLSRCRDWNWVVPKLLFGILVIAWSNSSFYTS